MKKWKIMFRYSFLFFTYMIVLLMASMIILGCNDMNFDLLTLFAKNKITYFYQLDGLVSSFNGISTFVGYPMSKPFS